VVEEEAKPSVRLSHRTITQSVRAGSSMAKREEVMHDWHKALLHDLVPLLIRKWEAKLGVKVSGYFLQRMKTKWGGCNPKSRSIRLNTELVKKPKDLLEYVVAHEMVHLIEPTHSERFIALITRHYPSWREARAELNELPLGAAAWNE
jgi:predicted metal-dependent hydrolase